MDLNRSDFTEENIEEVGVAAENVVSENVEVLSTNSIVDQLECRLKVGEVVKNVEDAYLLYCNYAHAKGFSVKKGDQRYFPGTNELQAKEFECSCEGSKDEKRSNDKLPIYMKPSSRSKCKANLRIIRQKEGEWHVGRFVIEHNHEMVAADQRHLLRSSRNISYAQKSTLEAMVNAGISVANAVSYMENEAQGPENLRFIRKDAYDHLGRLKKQTKVENGDASALLHHFINKSNKESNFYWNVQLDDDNRVMNFFLRDSRCQLDYEYFGDVLSVDTTYRTNRYNLICAPFVGINHHKQNVMFGLGFLSDETESSFEWLFKTFLESMNGKQPETIFTDQCQAMMNAIETVFSNSHHRLCQWHINQNAPSHLGSLNGVPNFKRLWNYCMNVCESEAEFEDTWRVMIDDYSVNSHKWLNSMYALRHKWATAFSNHRFSAGLLATSRSEVTNAVLKRLGNSVTSLYDFVLNYEKIQKSWRDREKAEDTHCQHTKAPMMLKNNPLLNDVAEIYTHTVFKQFELELMNSLNMRFIEMPSDFCSVSIQFKVKSHAENSRVRQVLLNKETLEVKCSCMKFESVGILCKHILIVFNFMNVNVIPKPYLKKRWMKNARNRVTNQLVLSDSSGSGRESEMVFVNQIMRLTYVLSLKCKVHEEARNKLTEIFDGAREQIDDLFENLKLDDPNHDETVIHEDVDDLFIRNPPQILEGLKEKVKVHKILNAHSATKQIFSNSRKILLGHRHNSTTSLHFQDLNFIPTNLIYRKIIQVYIKKIQWIYSHLNFKILNHPNDSIPDKLLVWEKELYKVKEVLVRLAGFDPEKDEWVNYRLQQLHTSSSNANRQKIGLDLHVVNSTKTSNFIPVLNVHLSIISPNNSSNHFCLEPGELILQM